MTIDQATVDALVEALATTARTLLRAGQGVQPMAVAVRDLDGAVRQDVVLMESAGDRVGVLRLLIRALDPPVVLVLADAWLTRYDRDEACPICLGDEADRAGCAYCRGQGRAILPGGRTEAAMIHAFWKDGRHQATAVRYARVGAGAPIFSPPLRIHDGPACAPYDRLWNVEPGRAE